MRHLGRRLAEVRSGEREPDPHMRRRAEREVLRHCLHAVDVNPFAVDLCRVSLWIEGQVTGEPLSFLDHRIRRGDSLIGVLDLAVLVDGIPDEAYTPLAGDEKAVAKDLEDRNAEEKKGLESFEIVRHSAGTLFDLAPRERLRELADRLVEIAAMPEHDVAAVRRKKAAFEDFRRSGAFERLKLACDLWCAAFFAPKTKETARKVPTTRHVWEALEDSARVPGDVRGLAEELAEEVGFFHWPLEFPDVFAEGGFDVVLGNPPWERIKLQEQEFFAARNPEIAAAPNAAARRRLIERLPETDPALFQEYRKALHRARSASRFLRTSGFYPLTGRGDINTYSVFAERMRALLRPGGRAGCVVPTGIATNDTNKVFFADVMSRGELVSLFDFENRAKLFPAVGNSERFCLLTLHRAREGKSRRQPAEFAFLCHRIGDLADPERRFTLLPEDFGLLNPNTRTAPIFRSRRDAELTKAIYRRVPFLVREGGDGLP